MSDIKLILPYEDNQSPPPSLKALHLARVRLMLDVLDHTFTELYEVLPEDEATLENVTRSIELMSAEAADKNAFVIKKLKQLREDKGSLIRETTNLQD
jgi:hypothetical protein